MTRKVHTGIVLNTHRPCCMSVSETAPSTWKKPRKHPNPGEACSTRGTFSFLMRPEKVTLVEWEVWSMKGQNEVNSGAKWQVTKLEEAKTQRPRGTGARRLSLPRPPSPPFCRLENGGAVDEGEPVAVSRVPVLDATS